MAEFKLMDTNRFYLPGTGNRFLHLASIHYSIREFICFVDKTENKTYIEEVTGGSLTYIEDDALASSLNAFLQDRGVLNLDRPFLPDNEWLHKRP